MTISEVADINTRITGGGEKLYTTTDLDRLMSRQTANMEHLIALKVAEGIAMGNPIVTPHSHSRGHTTYDQPLCSPF
jgi:hypothetical protein